MKEESGKKCPYCGAPLQENAAFCLHCMENLGDKTVIEKEKRKKKLLPVLVCVAAVLILCLAAAVIFRGCGKNEEPAGEKTESTAETEKKTDGAKKKKPSVEKKTDETTGEAADSAEETTGSAAEKSGEKSGEKTVTTAESKKESGSTKTRWESTETAKPQTVSKPETTTKAPTAATKAPENKKAPVTTAHTHSYTEKVIKSATCAAKGEKVRTCSCGDSYTSEIPATGAHSWAAVTKTVHHDEVGHYENQQTGTKKVTKYKCFYCTAGWFDSLDALKAHFTSHSDDPNYAYLLSHIEIMSDKKDFWEPVYEDVWVISRAAYDETVTVGYKCSVCGAEK